MLWGITGSMKWFLFCFCQIQIKTGIGFVTAAQFKIAARRSCNTLGTCFCTHTHSQYQVAVALDETENSQVMEKRVGCTVKLLGFCS